MGRSVNAYCLCYSVMMRASEPSSIFATIWFATTLVGAVACSGPIDPGPGKRVTASTNQTVFFPAQTVEVTVQNRSGIDLQYPYNFAGAKLEVEHGSGWATVAVQPSSLLIIRFLGAHET